MPTTPWLPDVALPILLALPLLVFFAYTIFGATGFGSSVIAVPLLAHWFPLTFAVPLITLIDLASTTNANLRQWRQADLRELGRLMPTGLVGIAAGVSLLVNLPRGPALLALGVFVTLYGVWLLTGHRQVRARTSSRWAWPAGLVGGVFSALFGTGGPIYMSYLAGRITDKTTLRATSALMVGFSVFVRAIAFLLTGILFQVPLLVTAALLIPVMFAGYWLGNRMHDRLSLAHLLKVIAVLLCGNGIFLVTQSMLRW